jgi:hypothetical protein
MKHIVYLTLFLIAPATAFSQGAQQPSGKHSIIVTPLGSWINDNKPSVYYSMVLHYDSSNYLNMRLGTELFSAIKHRYSSGREARSSAYNFKIGLEYGRRLNRISVYFGSEYSTSRYKGEGFTFFPTENVLFSANAIDTESSISPLDKAEMRLNALIGFVGFRYHINPQLSIGIESAIGRAWYQSFLEYDNPFFGIGSERHRGTLNDFAASRFVTLSYGF